jgi:monofunctional biosynthetic peptidoglycan transglycosylase
LVPLKTLGPNLPRAVIAAEDTRFYQHHGVDWSGMRQAVHDDMQRGKFWRGGSTITQQLVKNVFLTTHGSFARKLIEVPLSLLAELVLPKQRILELYLNVIEWAPGIYGGQAAAEHYYDLPAALLSGEQAARLAACLPAPRTCRPQRMNAYAAEILRRMRSTGQP